MIAYRDLYNTLEGDFDGCELQHIRRESTEEADMLANIGSTKAQVPPGVFLERITHRSIHKKRSTANSKEATAGNTPSTLDLAVEVLLCQGDHVIPAWTEPILAYMLREELPDDTTEARRITRRAKAYTIINGELHKRSTSGISKGA